MTILQQRGGRIGPTIGWLGRHPRSLIHVVVLVGAVGAWLHYWSVVPAGYLPAYKWIPLVGVILLIAEVVRFHDLSPVADFRGTYRRGDALLRQLGLPRLGADQASHSARFRRLPKGRVLLTWPTDLAGFSKAEVEAAAPRLYAELKANLHRVSDECQRWEIIYTRVGAVDSLGATVAFMPEKH